MQKSQGLGLSGSQQVAETRRPSTFTIGICATGRPLTLELLLTEVLRSEIPGFALEKVVVVASDCSIETLTAARTLANRDSRLRLIEHDTRSGKADALNEIFRETGSGFLVYVNADALVEAGAIGALLERIEGDDRLGFVSGKPVFERPGGLISDVLDVMWTTQNILSSDSSEQRWGNHGTDELMVVRRELLPELPHGIVNDGAYIAGKIRSQGFLIGFEPQALVRIDVPWRMMDLVRQRRRILFGHIQVKRLVGKAPRTVETMMLFDPFHGARVIVRMLASRPRRALFIPIAAVCEVIALVGALWDTTASSGEHAVWERYGQN